MVRHFVLARLPPISSSQISLVTGKDRCHKHERVYVGYALKYTLRRILKNDIEMQHPSGDASNKWEEVRERERDLNIIKSELASSSIMLAAPAIYGPMPFYELSLSRRRRRLDGLHYVEVL